MQSHNSSWLLDVHVLSVRNGTEAELVWKYRCSHLKCMFFSVWSLDANDDPLRIGNSILEMNNLIMRINWAIGGRRTTSIYVYDKQIIYAWSNIYSLSLSEEPCLFKGFQFCYIICITLPVVSFVIWNKCVLNIRTESWFTNFN